METPKLEQTEERPCKNENQKEEEDHKDVLLKSSIKKVVSNMSAVDIAYLNIDTDSFHIMNSTTTITTNASLKDCFKNFDEEPNFDWSSNNRINIFDETNLILLNHNCNSSRKDPLPRNSIVNSIFKFIYFDRIKQKLRHVESFTVPQIGKYWRPNLSINNKRSLFAMPYKLGNGEAYGLYKYTEPQFLLSKESCSKLMKKVNLKWYKSELRYVDYAEMSPDGEKIALIGNDDIHIEVYNINDNTMLLSKLGVYRSERSACNKLCKWVNEGNKILFLNEGFSYLFLLDVERETFAKNKPTDHIFLNLDYSTESPTTAVLGTEDGTVKFYDLRFSVEKRLPSLIVPKHAAGKDAKFMRYLKLNPKNSNEILIGTPYLLSMIDIRKADQSVFEINNNFVLKDPNFISSVI